MEFVELLSRWAHILSAIALVGGAMFMRFAFLPGAEFLSEENRETLAQEIRKRWSKVVMAAAGFLVLSGIFNMVMTMKTWELPKFYHPVIGIKMLLGIVVLLLASMLVGRSPAAAKMQKNLKFWLSLNLVLAVTVVCLGGFLRTHDHVKKQPKQETTVNVPESNE
ncbi:Cytochrome oxidase subunit II [Lignipirellula cremea]|uniref:Cytochrome oxidase subunit II n=2 Tax=Lignipirellula cremea TaxID=2528010 RepID=A0A518DTB4_9BACT|nr:Cytochrome oxidase subunit II [Lignipirellula cremea]